MRAYRNGMDSIKADVDGLSAFGAMCQRTAEQLGGIPVPQLGPHFQATSAAVQGVMTTASRAENLISVRLQVTGHTIGTAANRLAHCDSTSREEISVVGDEAAVM